MVATQGAASVAGSQVLVLILVPAPRSGWTVWGEVIAQRSDVSARLPAGAVHRAPIRAWVDLVADELAARLAASLPAPVILTGGMNDADGIREAFASTGAAAVMLARGVLGNPWLFSELLREPSHAGHEQALEPSREQVLAELRWTIERAVEHLGEPRATRYLRKFYPWYVPRLRLEAGVARSLQESLQTAPTLVHAHELLDGACQPAALVV